MEKASLTMVVAEKEEATKAVTTLESFPVEIRTDIFSRVDARTLTRFLCVSKPLSSFVTTPDLISAHRIRSRKNPLLLFFISSSMKLGSQRLVSFDTTIMTASYTNISPQNRDLSFSRMPSPVLTRLELVCVHQPFGNTTLVFNPANNYMQVLPPFDRPVDCSDTKYVGFGYIPSMDQYKVLRVSDAYRYLITEVFTLGADDNWRHIEQQPPVRIGASPPVLINASIYFKNEKNLFEDIVTTICKFDLEREEWSLLPVIPFTLKSNYWHLNEMGGSLCLVDIDKEGMYIDVWTLKDLDTYLWEKEYHIDMCFLGFAQVMALEYAYPVTVGRDGRLLMLMNGKNLFYYDLRTKNFEDVNLKEKFLLGNGHKVKQTAFYVDSVLSLENRS